MKRKNTILAILIVFSLSLLFGLYWLMMSRKRSIAEGRATPNQRVFRDSPYKFSKTFKHSSPFKSIFAQDDTLLALDETGSILVLDCELNQLRKLPPFDPLKNRILDVFVRGNGECLVLDGSTGSVYSILTDTMVALYQAPFQIIRGEFIDENELLIKAALPGNPETVYFINVSLQSTDLHVLKVHEPEVDYPDMTLDGFLVSGSNNILHVCYKTGLFSCFSKRGMFLYTRATWDHSPPPTILVSSSGTKRYNPYSTTINLHASSDNEAIYILSVVRSPNDVPLKNVIDCYGVKNGEYLYSFSLELQESLPGFVKTGSNLIGFRKNTILLFKSL